MQTWLGHAPAVRVNAIHVVAIRAVAVHAVAARVIIADALLAVAIPASIARPIRASATRADSAMVAIGIHATVLAITAGVVYSSRSVTIPAARADYFRFFSATYVARCNAAISLWNICLAIVVGCRKTRPRSVAGSTAALWAMAAAPLTASTDR